MYDVLSFQFWLAMKNTSVFSTLLVGSSFTVGTIVANLAAPAHAITLGTCSNADVKYTSGSNQISASACSGELETNSTDWPFNNDVTGSGNPLRDRLNNLFGTSYNWSLVRKDEQAGNQGTFDGFSSAQSGNWSVSPSINGPFAISLKASNGFAVYLFDNITQAVTSGIWSTAGIRNSGGNQPNLSHISLFTAPATAVPEPITMLGIGVGIVGGGVLKQKYGKKANKGNTKA